ncbi:MAG: UDP-N-acetylmuramoyl-tripeptide--D-alanyl-D-alanine ligase [Vulcanibacillus sp.]
MAKPLVLNKPVIAITGSAGKTTTKEMLASILQISWKTFKTYGNANAPRHTAKYAKSIKSFHKAVILEYGMSKPGEIRRSCLIIKPNIGIVTNVGTAHIGNFKGSIYGVANTKSDLIRYMKSTGLLFLNADDRNSKLLDTKEFKGKIFTVSQNSDVQATYKARNVQYAKQGMKFEAKIDNKYYDFYIPIYGKHNIYNALFAIAVAHQLGFTYQEIRKGLAKYKKPYRRLTVYPIKNKILIIDDTFSANPNAVRAAIDVMCSIGVGKKIAVLGSMLEMGSYKYKGHKEVGKYLADKKIDYLYTYGKDALSIAEGAKESKFPKEKIKNFYSQENLTRYLISNVKSNSTVLFKASHAMRLDRIVSSFVKYKKSH